MGLKIEVIPNKLLKKELAKREKKVLGLFGDIVAGEIHKFVPYRTGFLSQSAFNGGRRVKSPYDNDTSVYITYKAVYAKKLYFGEGFNFSTNSHPLAKAYWGRETLSNTPLMTRLLKAAYMKAGK